MRPRRPARPRPSGRERRARVARPRAMMRAGAKAWPRRRDGTSRRARRRRAWPRPSARGVCSGRTTAFASASSASATAATRCSTPSSHRGRRGRRHLRPVAAVPRLRRREGGRRAAAASRTTGSLLDRQRRRRRRHRDARPLARAADDRRVRGRQGRLRREAALAARGRGPAHGGGGATVRAREPGRAATGARRPSSPKRRRSCATARSGKRHRRAHVPRAERVAEGHRQPDRRAPAAGPRLGRVARPGPDACRTTATAPSTGSAGSTTTRAARSRTSARTTST